MHARHILVATEAEAKEIIAQLKKGADFAKLAKENSTRPRRADGGDLGLFKKDDMVPEFCRRRLRAEARPVSPTDAGADAVRLARHPGGGGAGTAPPPTFDDVKDELRQKMIQEDVQKVVAQAQQGVKVQKFNLDGTPQRRPTTPSRRRARRDDARPSATRRLMPAVSPLAVPLPALPPLAGVRLGAAAAGIRYQGRTDLVMAEFAPGTTVAGVFTRNKCPGAPVDWCRAALPQRRRARAGGERRATPTSSPARPGGCRAKADGARPPSSSAARHARCIVAVDRRDRRGAAARAHHRRPAGSARSAVARMRGKKRRAAS